MGAGPTRRPAARSQAAIKFIDQPNQTADDSPAGGLEGATPEALQQNIGHKTGENEVHDGRGVVSEAMIQRQVCGEHIEAIVLDVPAAMPGIVELACR